jgi:hypothetical protein
METGSTGLVSAGELLAALLAGLDRLDPDRVGLEPSVRLEWLRQARLAQSRLTGLCSMLAAEAEQAQSSEKATGSPLKVWLGRQEPLSRSEASAVVHQARVFAGRPVVAEAAVAGRVSIGQARAITKLLDGLKGSLDGAQVVRAEELLVGWAGRMDAKQLEGAAAKVLAEVAPVDADDVLERRLQAEAEAGWRNRRLRFWKDGGSLCFEGSLPRVEGEAWVALIHAHTEAARRTAIEARDPLAVRPTIEQRRADALISLIRNASKAKPVVGAGTATVIVTLDYDRLAADAAGAGLLGANQQLSAGELRQLCCDAGLIPVVLGGESEVLDVGRSSRLVAPVIRTALIARDGGCVFPGCTVPAQLCEAHHVVPWHLGGRTALDNLVLQCHSDHGLVEPARHGTRDQWEVRIAEDGLPEFIPPMRIDPERRPLRHARHQASARAG